MEGERNEMMESHQTIAEKLTKLQQSEKLVTQERDGLQKEGEAIVAAAGDEGTNASYIETLKAGYEEQIKEMNAEVLKLQTTGMQQRQEAQQMQSTIDSMEGERDK